ncbi:hypothetical protein PIB30_046260 [Stylosanthes scabra]|uniref:Uncharacterized protein n=1 Tax=Stylosanthes scabra TaxID=79078 RepID=A0ABU6XE48_9FABA|nr:hypothetical protein [Stylosanthes scabra]
MGSKGPVCNIDPTREFESLDLASEVIIGLSSDGSEIFPTTFVWPRLLILPSDYYVLVDAILLRQTLPLSFSDVSKVKKKSCQNVRCPRVLFEAERTLYGWADDEVFSQPSVVTADMLLELRREMRLTEDKVAEEDYVIEAVGPFDRLPFRAAEDRTHLL